MPYNGWSNYETWATSLWMGNDAGSYHYFRELAQECWDRAGVSVPDSPHSLSRSTMARIELAKAYRERIGDSLPDLEASLAADLLGAALCEVDWQEIADSWLDDMELDGYERRHDGR